MTSELGANAVSLKIRTWIQAIAPEASLPLRGHRRPAFFERVSQLLKDADVLIPARVLEACRRLRVSFSSAGRIDVADGRGEY
jgi:hypothetical protein